MLERLALQPVRDRLAGMPAVALLGPRQCGKTTLARSLGGTYLDLEQEPARVRFDLSFDALAAGDSLVVLDEAQAWPEIFPRLRGAIDADRKRNGRFLVLGSVSPSLMTEVSQSLAGRLGLVALTPLLLPEVGVPALDALWAYGGFPDGGVLDPSAYPAWQLDYLQLLTRRDLPDWGLAARPRVTERLLRMIAAVHGQTQNVSRLAQSLGLATATVTSYLDHLEGAYLIRRLPAYHANVRKRLVKSPKLYVRDSGLLHALLGAPDVERLIDAPWVGASFEGFVIEQVLGVLALNHPAATVHHLRTARGEEIDLVVERGDERWAIEVKLSTQVRSDDLTRLEHVSELIGAQRRVLVSRSPDVVDGGTTVAADLPWLLGALADW
ncbi:MAG: ATP-binding protein [Planctomycetes bacterium]|nr:ATP-binding protein [Planctomycetota bacterium]